MDCEEWTRSVRGKLGSMEWPSRTWGGAGMEEVRVGSKQGMNHIYSQMMAWQFFVVFDTESSRNHVQLTLPVFEPVLRTCVTAGHLTRRAANAAACFFGAQ